MPTSDLTSTDAMGSELASWTPLVVMLLVFTAVVVALAVLGRGRPLERIPEALERLTGIPGWAAVAVGTSVFGLFVAGQGFYSDVAWHIALGRDEQLFTAPHTSIVVGLALILLASAFGTIAATVADVRTGFTLGALRVPWSMVPLAALGGAALTGFPLDEVWHQAYGVDVTMWSPTHMIMILGAAFSGLALWLVLADAGVSPTDSRWARGLHLVAGWLTLLALTSPMGEFDFGVPQFQQMFHPMLVTLAASVALVAIRLVHGPGWAVAVIIGNLVFDRLPLFGDDGPVPTREAGLYLVSALVVEGVAATLGTDRRLRFALASGAGVATIGLAAEWAWNQGAVQPWTSNLLPDALVLCAVVGLGGAVIGAAFAAVVRPEASTATISGRSVLVAGAAVLVALVLPLPRGTAEVTADVRLTEQTAETAVVRVRLDPVDAADDARWFQTISWQGGELVVADMVAASDGWFESDEPVPVTGRGKALVRLHRGGELMAAPVYLPADPEIGEPEIPAVDRTVALTDETTYLLRETTDGGGIVRPAIYGVFLLILGGWATAFGVAARHIAGRTARREPGDRPLDQTSSSAPWGS